MTEQAQLYGTVAVSTTLLASYYSDHVMQRLTALQALIDAVRVTIGG